MKNNICEVCRVLDSVLFLDFEKLKINMSLELCGECFMYFKCSPIKQCFMCEQCKAVHNDYLEFGGELVVTKECYLANKKGGE